MTTDPFSFSYKAQGWFDIANHMTTPVSAPATAALFGLGLLGLAGLRRRRAA